MLLALPPAHPPAKSVAGVHITWPTEKAVLPGSPITVKVSSKHRRAVLAFVRVTSAGKPVAAVARKTLRSGTFKAAMPAGTATYQLRATIAGKRYWSWIATSHPLASPVTTPAAAPVTYPCWPDLGYGMGPYTATLQATPPAVVVPGSVVPFSVVNTSPHACVMYGGGYAVKRRLDDGSWRGIDLHVSFSLGGYLLAPGAATASAANIPTDAPAGTYRITETVHGDADGRPSIPLTSPEFTIVAPSSCDSIVVETFTVDPATVVRGTTFSFTSGALSGETGKWEVKDGDSWVDYPAGTVDPVNHTASLPNDAPAGTYRIHESSSGGDCPGDRQAQSDPITVS